MSYKYLASRIVFSRFSWSLETVAEDSFDWRQAASSFKVDSSVQLFDTLDCSLSGGDAASGYRLEVLLSRQVEKEEGDDEDTASNSLRGQSIANSLDEALIGFISKQTNLARSQVNQFELQQVDSSEIATSFIVDAIITRNLRFEFDRILIGWIKDYALCLHEKTAKIIKFRLLMSRHECSLRMSSLMAQQKSSQSAIARSHLLYCPYFGCGYIEDLSRVKYISRDNLQEKPDPSVYFNMCEIYELNLKVSSGSIVSSEDDIYSVDKIKRELQRVQFSTPIRQGDGRAPVLVHANVLKVALTTGLGSGLFSKGKIDSALEQPLASGQVCLKPDDDVASEPATSGSEQLIKTIRVQLDAHHSRVHCHSLCLMSPFCNLYSYEHTRRECTISSVQKQFVQRDLFDKEGSCKLFAANHVHLYKRANFIIYTSAEELKRRAPIAFLANLDECASLCRQNELSTSRETKCSSFEYMDVKQVCALDTILPQEPEEAAANSTTRNKEITISEHDFEQKIGPKDYRTTSLVETYKRDYAQHYSSKQGTAMEIVEPLPVDGAQQQQSAIGATLYELNRDDCWRECTIVDLNCVAVDYCAIMPKQVHTVRRYCRLFHIRSPFSFSSSLASGQEEPEELRAKLSAKGENGIALNGNGLSKLESRFYLDEHGDEFRVSTKRLNCVHYYLSGDNLYLKRRLASAIETRREDWLDANKQIGAIARFDLELSANSSSSDDSTRGKGSQTGATLKELATSNSLVALLSQIVFGLAIGMFLYDTQSRISNAYRREQVAAGPSLSYWQVVRKWLAERREQVAQLKRTPRNRQRSSSQVEFTEMLEV